MNSGLFSSGVCSSVGLSMLERTWSVFCTQVLQLDSNHLGADVNDAVQTVLVFNRSQQVKETKNKRLISATLNDFRNTERVEFQRQADSLLFDN